jgi:hypothetical protein
MCAIESKDVGEKEGKNLSGLSVHSHCSSAVAILLNVIFDVSRIVNQEFQG